MKRAVENVVGGAPLETARATGHHGNEIIVVEVHSTDPDSVKRLLRMLSAKDRGILLSTLDHRLDDSCSLFLRVDKQAAYSGSVELTDSEDVIAIRVKVNAYPARREVAAQKVVEFVESIESGE